MKDDRVPPASRRTPEDPDQDSAREQRQREDHTDRHPGPPQESYPAPPPPEADLESQPIEHGRQPARPGQPGRWEEKPGQRDK